jgi:outer membrane protein OmpA-like peptidoglycan-associated protein
LQPLSNTKPSIPLNSFRSVTLALRVAFDTWHFNNPGIKFKSNRQYSLMKNTLRFLLIFFFVGISVVHAHPPAKYPPLHSKTNRVKTPYTDSSIVIIIPFEYKQSALYQTFTFTVIDSVINVLFKDKDISLSIYGYSHPDEGSDTICKYLALNRALFVKDYVLGRGVRDNRLSFVEGKSKSTSKNTNVDKDGHSRNCRVELKLSFPAPEVITIIDTDEDGIEDSEDGCSTAFGEKENHGCPDANAIIVPFQAQTAKLSGFDYEVLDSVIAVLRHNPTYTLKIQGHAYRLEGTNKVCKEYADQRIAVVRNYLLSRFVSAKQIVSIENMVCRHPLNAGKTPMEIALNSRAQLTIIRK